VGFLEKLLIASRQQNSLLCVGLDPEPQRFPAELRDMPVDRAVVRFCHAIIEATALYVCAYKPNLAFFEVLGPIGMQVFQEVLRAIPAHIPVIADAKRGDLGNTARNYASALFDVYGCDAATVNPYLGYDSVAPFLAYRDKGVLLLCRTSNPSARDFQDVPVKADDGLVRPLYEVVALKSRRWNRYGNVGLVVGATAPSELQCIRALAPDLPILIPAIGAQGGDLVASARAHRTEAPAVVSASRAVLYASSGTDFADAARSVATRMRDQLREHQEL